MSLETAQRIFVVFNTCEGLLWIGIAIAFAVTLCRHRRNIDLMTTAGLAFLTFGLSDFVEIQTGGWYRPWWLLTWKTANVVCFVILYVLYRRRLADH